MALIDDILRLFGTNRTRLRWKWERLKGRLAAERSRAENRARVVTYAHKACPECGHPADRFARRCGRCGARMPGVVIAKLSAIGRVLLDADGGFAATSTLLVANIGVYFLMFKQSQQLTPSPAQAIRWGAWVTPLANDWVRWVTSCFLHGGPLHLAFNMLALLQLGPVLEGIYGRRRFELIYLTAGVLGMAVSSEWNAHQGHNTFGLGASGAIFGIIGAASVYGLRRGGRIAADFRRQFITWAIYAFLIGIVLRADYMAHAGGFVGGALVGLLLSDKDQARPAPSWLWALVELALIAVVVYCFYQVWLESRILSRVFTASSI